MNIKEFSFGDGIADLAYIPKRRSLLTGLIVELKWDKKSVGAINRIKYRNYYSVLTDYTGENNSSRD